MPSRLCIVSFSDEYGLTHSVEVTAASLYEAGARALRAFAEGGLEGVTRPTSNAVLSVKVRTPESTHEVGVGSVRDWLDSNGRSPREQALKVELRG